MEPLIITHTDLDGIASAATYCRLRKLKVDEAKVFFTEPESLPRVLEDASKWMEEGELVICDLGLNADFLQAVARSLGILVSRGIKIRWFDHHVWEEGWIKTLRNLGVELYVDRTTCAAGVVLRYAGGDPDDITRELVRAACAADIWKWDHPLAPRLFRVAGRFRGAKGDAWNRHLLHLLASGVLWNDELQEALEEYIRLELKGYEEGLKRARIIYVNGCKVAIIAGFRGPPGNSLLAAYVLSRTKADVVAITRRFSSLSLRSRKVDVRRIAAALGGGGHPEAAGAGLNPPLLIRLLGALFPWIKVKWFSSVIESAIRKSGCHEIQKQPQLSGDPRYGNQSPSRG